MSMLASELPQMDQSCFVLIAQLQTPVRAVARGRLPSVSMECGCVIKKEDKNTARTAAKEVQATHDSWIKAWSDELNYRLRRLEERKWSD